MAKRRNYEKTHSWINFSVDLNQVPFNLWIILGECQSKCEHIKDAPILPNTKRELYRLYLAKGIHATTAIEGNTLTENEVIEHLKGELHLPPSREYQTRELDNIIKACNEVLEIIKTGSTPYLDIESIKTLNRKILDGLPVEEHVTPGELRKVPVGVFRYRGAPPEDCEYLLERLCDWLNGPNFEAPNSSMTFIFAIIKAVVAHLYIAWIHPFGDGNGRTARLLEFIILISSGIPATAAHLLSDHYNRTRPKYYIELDKTSKSNGNVIPFWEYAMQGLLDGLREQVEAIQNQQWEVVWRDFVYRTVKGRSSVVRARKRALVFALSGKESLSIVEIGGLPQLVREYPGNRSSILKHDIDELVKDGLLVREKGRIRGNIEAISGFKNISVDINQTHT